MEIIKDESHFGMIDWWKKVFLENFDGCSDKWC